MACVSATHGEADRDSARGRIADFVLFLFLTFPQYIGISIAVNDRESFMNDRILPLRRPEEKTVDPGKPRPGDCLVSAAVPSLHRPEKSTADTGKLRLGDCMISAPFARL